MPPAQLRLGRRSRSAARARSRGSSRASRSARPCGAGGSSRRATGACRDRRPRRPRPPRACSRRGRRRGGRRGSALRASSRSWLHSIVARSVCWRGSASRPPLSRSSRCESRSRICAGESTLVRAAASSIASGRSSSRRQSSAIVSSGSSRERSQKSSTASGSASGGTGYSTSPLIRSSSRLVTRSFRFGQRSSSAEIRCRLDHLLEVVEQQQELALADVLREAVLRPERLRDRLGHERRVAQRGQADPEDAGRERRARARRRPRARAASCPSHPARRG